MENKKYKKDIESPVLPVYFGGETSNLLTISEAAQFLNLKTSRIRNMIFKKSIPFIKLGASIRFNRIDLDVWLKTKTQNVNL